MQTITQAIDQHAIDFGRYVRAHEHTVDIFTLYRQYQNGFLIPSALVISPIQGQDDTTKAKCAHIFKRGSNIGKKCETETKNTLYCSKHRVKQVPELNKEEQFKYDLMTLLQDDTPDEKEYLTDEDIDDNDLYDDTNEVNEDDYSE